MPKRILSIVMALVFGLCIAQAPAALAACPHEGGRAPSASADAAPPAEPCAHHSAATDRSEAPSQDGPQKDASHSPCTCGHLHSIAGVLAPEASRLRVDDRLVPVEGMNLTEHKPGPGRRPPKA
jgi:hypothetical protein